MINMGASTSPRKKALKKKQLRLVKNIYNEKPQIPPGWLTKLPIAKRPRLRPIELEEAFEEEEVPRPNNRVKVWGGQFHFLCNDTMQLVSLELFLKDNIMISIAASPPCRSWTSFCVVTE
jgi:hypothetical protein